jgi:hypothetical protein
MISVSAIAAFVAFKSRLQTDWNPYLFSQVSLPQGRDCWPYVQDSLHGPIPSICEPQIH